MSHTAHTLIQTNDNDFHSKAIEPRTTSEEQRLPPVTMSHSAHSFIQTDNVSYSKAIQPPTSSSRTTMLPSDEEACSASTEQASLGTQPDDAIEMQPDEAFDLQPDEAFEMHPAKHVKYALSELPANTAQQIEAMRVFYTSEFNLLRTGECMKQETFAKMKERVLCKMLADFSKPGAPIISKCLQAF